MDERGRYKITPLEKWGSSAHREDRPSMYFAIKSPDGKDYFPVAPDGLPGRWRVGLERMNRLIMNDEIDWRMVSHRKKRILHQFLIKEK